MLKVENIGFSYKKNKKPIVEQISFEVPDGCLTAVLGINGVGKSTILKCIDRILTPDTGRVYVDGRDMLSAGRQEAARNMAFVPQSAESSDITVFDMLLLGRRPYIKWDATEQDHSIVAQTAESMGLEDKLFSPMSELSGGEAQKVLLARALVQQPRLLLLDEPTSNLDPRNQHSALKLIRGIVKEKNISALVVLHDLNLALRYCDSFVFLKDSKLFAQGGIDIVTPRLLKEIYAMDSHIVEYEGIPTVIPIE